MGKLLKVLCVGLAFFALPCFADRIVMRDGSIRENARIARISDNEIEFRVGEREALHSVRRADVLRIIYSDGTEDVFTAPPPVQTPPPPPPAQARPVREPKPASDNKGFGNYNRFGIGIKRDNDDATFTMNYSRRQNFFDFGLEFGLGGYESYLGYYYTTGIDDYMCPFIRRSISFESHFEFINHVIVGTGIGLGVTTVRHMKPDVSGSSIVWERVIFARMPEFNLSPRLGYEWAIRENLKLQYRLIYSLSFAGLSERSREDLSMNHWGENTKFREHSLGNDIMIYRDWIALNFGFSFFNMKREEYRVEGDSRNPNRTERNTIGLNTNLGVSILF